MLRGMTSLVSQSTWSSGVAAAQGITPRSLLESGGACAASW